MITEQELKDRCTQDVIKKMVELAEGFMWQVTTDEYEYISLPDGFRIDFNITKVPNLIFPLLIHRAVEGWNKKNHKHHITIDDIALYKDRVPELFKNYQTSSLTPCECACLHCLIEVLG